eukprot:6220609-Amphidinium_carterae.1
MSRLTSGCLSKKGPCAEELVSSAAEEQRLAAFKSFGHRPCDTWSSWTLCGGEHAAGKRLHSKGASRCSSSTKKAKLRG